MSFEEIMQNGDIAIVIFSIDWLIWALSVVWSVSTIVSIYRNFKTEYVDVLKIENIFLVYIKIEILKLCKNIYLF